MANRNQKIIIELLMYTKVEVSRKYNHKYKLCTIMATTIAMLAGYRREDIKIRPCYIEKDDKYDGAMVTDGCEATYITVYDFNSESMVTIANTLFKSKRVKLKIGVLNTLLMLYNKCLENAPAEDMWLDAHYKEDPIKVLSNYLYLMAFSTYIEKCNYTSVEIKDTAKFLAKLVIDASDEELSVPLTTGVMGRLKKLDMCPGIFLFVCHHLDLEKEGFGGTFTFTGAPLDCLDVLNDKSVCPFRGSAGALIYVHKVMLAKNIGLGLLYQNFDTDDYENTLYVLINDLKPNSIEPGALVGIADYAQYYRLTYFSKVSGYNDDKIRAFYKK